MISENSGKENVCVLMSTYNGSKYVIEQIKSILYQKNVNVDIYIRDDNSSDNTIDIIVDYVKKNSIKNVYLRKGKNIGPGTSFMRLLYDVGDYDYYSFSDQDDIWMPDKLIKAINKLQKFDDIPCLYASDQYVTDEFGNIKGKHFDKIPPHDLANMFVANHLNGCTMVFNKKLYDILNDKKIRPNEMVFKYRMHDTWVGLVANCTGKIIYDNDAYILYRQHAENVVGAKEKNIIGYIKACIDGLRGKGYFRIQRKTAKQLIESFKDYPLKESDMYIIKQFDQLNSLSGRIRFCLNKQFINSISSSSNHIRLKVMLGGW